MDAKQYEQMKQSFKQLGIKYKELPLYRNNFASGKRPYAIRVSVQPFGFQVDLATPEEHAAEAKQYNDLAKKKAAEEARKNARAKAPQQPSAQQIAERRNECEGAYAELDRLLVKEQKEIHDQRDASLLAIDGQLKDESLSAEERAKLEQESVAIMEKHGADLAKLTKAYDEMRADLAEKYKDLK